MPQATHACHPPPPISAPPVTILSIATPMLQPFTLDLVDLDAICRDHDQAELEKMVEFIVGACVMCENKQK